MWNSIWNAIKTKALVIIEKVQSFTIIELIIVGFVISLI